MHRVTAAIVLYNAGELIPVLAGTLEGLPGVKRVFYDSGSSDGSVNGVRKRIPGATVIEGPNRGFGYGCNRCLERIDTGYTLLLNSDAAITADSLGKLVSFLDGNDEYAGVQPVVRMWDHPPVTASRGVFLTRYGEAWDSGFMHFEPFLHTSPVDVPAITAAVSLWRTDVLKELRGFDESFFMYFEDADLSLRARARGYRTAVAREASARHMAGWSSTRKAAGIWELQSSVLLFKRYLGGGSLKPFWWKREARAAVGALLRGRSPIRRLRAVTAAAAVPVRPVELPGELRSLLFGSPLDMPLERVEHKRPNIARPWVALKGPEGPSTLLLESVSGAVTGAILTGNDSPPVRFCVPAGGSRNYRLAPGAGVVYINCDSPGDELKAEVHEI